MSNTALPGNPRYQPKDLIPIFGYDNLTASYVAVELATLDVLGRMGVIPAKHAGLLTLDLRAKLLEIPTSLVDRVEREDTEEYGLATRHDIRALVRVMQKMLPPELARWVHIPLTSYDVISTGRSIQFARAHREVVRPKVHLLVQAFVNKIESHIDVPQIGRTHGQHAVPITVGFWLATILSRILNSAKEMDRRAVELQGKISGPVGAYNAQAVLKLYYSEQGRTLEETVVQKLGLKVAPISTQILSPERLAHYLFACLSMSADLGQFGLDCRHLMRTEIGELGEPFESGQVGSSTMAHKRNPIHFESLEGMWEGNKAEFQKVFSWMLSEHQRDLVGSSIERDLPTIVVRLVTQLDTLLRWGKKDPRAFVERLFVDEAACRRNLRIQGDFILAEIYYIAIQMVGFPGDAHEMINHVAVPKAHSESTTLFAALDSILKEDGTFSNAWSKIAPDLKKLSDDPSQYSGFSAEKARQVVRRANKYILT